MKFKTELTKRIFKSKYLLPYENSPDEAVDRIVKVVKKYYPTYYKRIEEYIHKRWLLPAGGLWRAAINPDKNVSCINCTTLEQPEDNLESIFNSYYWWGKYAAFGQGEGIDLSKLRPRGSIVHNSSRTSTGAVSFMYIYNTILETIAQEGRRGASLISLNISHPDIQEFIHVKDEDGILSNSNISIQITDKFMRAVKENKEWNLVFKNKYETFKKVVNAPELFCEICEHAWKSGDPGLQFIDTAMSESNSNVLGYDVVSTNACCFTPDTLITTKNGLFPIIDLIGKETEIYDGNEWVKNSSFAKMGKDEDIYRVTLRSGIYFDVTSNHRFYLENKEIKTAIELNKNDKLQYDLQNNIVHGSVQEKGVYLKGFLLGDGSIRKDIYGNIAPMLYLYFPKYCCKKGLEDSLKELSIDNTYCNTITEVSWYSHKNSTEREILNGLSSRERQSLYKWASVYKKILPKEIFQWDEISKCNFIAGIFDADGCALEGSKGFGYQLCSINKEFLIDLLRLLSTLGIYGKLDFVHEEKNKVIKGKEYLCKEVWRISIPQKYSIVMASKIKFNRLKDLSGKETKYNISFKYNRVVSVERLPEKTDVYCAMISSTHKFLINGGIITGNSEQWLDSDNVCLLSSYNLGELSNNNSNNSYDLKIQDEIIECGIIMLDAFRRYEYDENRSPNKKQREKLISLPRIGLGVTGLADYFINQNIVYGEEKSIIEAGNIFKRIAEISYKTSQRIAEVDGESFSSYDKKKYINSKFIRRLLDENIITEKNLNYQAHVCKNTVAPNGTVTEIAEVGGGGIEPIFSKYFVRRERATTGKFKEWFTYNHAVRNYLDYKEIDVTKENTDKLIDPWWITAHSVENLQKIKLISEIQKWIDSAISVTYNLPQVATVENIKDIYFSAWKNKLKGVAVFREGSKPGILITEENYKETLQEKAILNRFTSIRPETVECDIFEKNVNKERHIILVGLVENKPYEIFVTNDIDDKIDLERHKKGYITKVNKGRYDLQVVDEKEKTILKDISKVFDKEYGSLSRMVSMSLRHKVPIPFIIDQLSKDKQFDSFEKAVLRTLKNYIDEGEEVITSDNKCPNCGAILIYQNGCKSCINNECNWSRCD